MSRMRWNCLMTIGIIILAALAIMGTAASLLAVSHDGYHRIPTRR